VIAPPRCSDVDLLGHHERVVEFEAVALWSGIRKCGCRRAWIRGRFLGGPFSENFAASKDACASVKYQGEAFAVRSAEHRSKRGI
jgi:hypothetical protein